MLCPDENLGRHGGKPATNCLSYGMAWHAQQVSDRQLDFLETLPFIHEKLFYFHCFVAINLTFSPQVSDAALANIKFMAHRVVFIFFGLRNYY
jgi:hypothetical protein